MYDTVLVPVDETAETTRLTERAIDLAHTWDATLHVVGVVDGPTALNAEAVGQGDRVSGARERARRSAMRATERAERADVDAYGTVRRGIAHAEIVEEARRISADLVLLGPTGRETTQGAVCSGQVTSEVVDRADCAVLVEQSTEELESDSAEVESEAEAAPTELTASTTREGSTDGSLLVSSQ